MTVERVLVVGAGIGGLAAAAALGRYGIAVDVIETSDSPDVPGVGINQPGNSLHEFSGPLRDIRDEIADDAPGIVYSPLVEINVERAWHDGRVIVLGDAVHTAVPHLTQGAAMAIEDAVVLADEVAGERSLPESLRDVERLRRPRTDLVFAAAHGILMQEQSISPDTLPAVLAGMRNHLAEQTAQVESVLNQPFQALPAHRQGALS